MELILHEVMLESCWLVPGLRKNRAWKADKWLRANISATVLLMPGMWQAIIEKSEIAEIKKKKQAVW